MGISLEKITSFFKQIEDQLGRVIPFHLRSVSSVLQQEELDYVRSCDPALDLRFSSQKRLAEWVSSRCALYRMLERFSIRSDDQWRVSLSHTSEFTLACGVMEKKEQVNTLRIGVDLESTKRQMSRKAVVRVFSPSELGLGLAPIALWTIKEAAFKAFAEEGLVLPQISILSWDLKKGQAVVKSLRSERICRVWLFTSPELVLSFAFWTESFLGYESKLESSEGES